MARTAEALESHLRDELIPWWLDHGVDRAGRGFVETLERDGAAGPETERRLRSVTRLLYAFSVGARLGVPGAGERATEAYEHLQSVHGDPDHGGFFRTASPAGVPVDRRKDTYDHAFAVLALAEYAASCDAPAALTVAGETATLVTTGLADEVHGGYFEGASEDWTPLRSGPRHQNPHMHWVEALLALHHRSGDARWLEAADTLVALCAERFLDPNTGTLGETFGPAWERSVEASLVEPGHHYEWVWLLEQHGSAGGRTPASPLADPLFTFAESHGLTSRGHVRDAVFRDGHPARPTQRLWPQTERVKALAARQDLVALEACLDVTLAAYATPRGWHEELDADGTPTATRQRATSLYHVVLALVVARDALA